MAIESANYVGEMNKNIPAELDSISEGAAQIAAIKHALVTSFPNIKGTVISNHDELNDLSDGMALFYVGMIMPFWGDILPNFWVWCDGKNGTPKLNTEDPTYLAGYSGAKGTEFGSNSDKLAKYVTTENTALEERHIPAHSHTTLWHHKRGATWRGGASGTGAADANSWFNRETGEFGANQGHKHTISDSKDYTYDNKPNTMSIKYIMYTGVDNGN